MRKRSNKPKQTHLLPLHVIASPKGVAISSVLGLRSLFRAKRGISEFASVLPRNRFTPRNDKLLDASVLVRLISALIICVLGWAMRAEALEPTLKWKKEFKYKVRNVDLATETGDVILSLENGGEIVLFDKDGNERFHWGPRIDRRAGGAGISKDGRYFVFYSGYTGTYADRKKVPGWSDDRIHFYNRQTKKELWNYKSLESVPLISPDGSLVISYSIYGFKILNFDGRKTFEYHPNTLELGSVVFSPDSNFSAVTGFPRGPLILFKRDGTKLWEKGRHSLIASISEGASYISTYPYSLGLSYTADPENTHKGTVYDRNGNKVLEGFGILSGNGSRIAMYSPDKITIIGLPNKQIMKEIPVQVGLPNVSNPFFAVFSYDGGYLVARRGNSVLVFDLVGDVSKEITLTQLGKFPEVQLTRESKYLLIHPTERGYERLVYYYQLY